MVDESERSSKYPESEPKDVSTNTSTLHCYVDVHTLSATLVNFKHTLYTCIYRLYSYLRSHEELLICASKGPETSS